MLAGGAEIGLLSDSDSATYPTQLAFAHSKANRGGRRFRPRLLSLDATSGPHHIREPAQRVCAPDPDPSELEMRRARIVHSRAAAARPVKTGARHSFRNIGVVVAERIRERPDRPAETLF